MTSIDVCHSSMSYSTASTSDGDHEASPRSCAVDIYRDDDGMAEVEMDEETPAEIAMLLASVADIAKREMSCDVVDHRPISRALDHDAIPRFPDLSSSYGGVGFDDERMDDADREEGGSEMTPHPPSMAMMHFDHKKTRAVSLDHPNFHRGRYETTVAASPCRHALTPPPHEDEAIPTLLRWRNLSCDVTIDHSHRFHGISKATTTSPPPLTSSILHGSALTSNPTRPRAVSMAEAVIENRPIDVPSAEVGDCATANVDERPMKVILRKKFSWKNYPDLEEFLVANRDEYLRHSTLNYTMQQKKYNNCLTLRMIKLAAEHGYVFDDAEFSFVTVRDRIRCYFKSYVQSMKKRGVVIGYAARKAGLVTEEELEESAHTSGKIYVPKN